MKRATDYEGDLGRYLEPIRALPFVTALDCTVAPQGAGDREIDAEIIKITPPRSRFKLAVEFKRTYLERATLECAARAAGPRSPKAENAIVASRK